MICTGIRQDVVAAEEGRVGRLHLNRPEVINALTLPMIRSMRAALEKWRWDRGVQTVLITGAGERGLCAGGDIRFVWDNAQHHPDRVRRLWREEYSLDHTIATYPKPVVVVADGITMGGGIGLVGHASHRVVTPRSTLAMPEVRIGLAPDVGGLWLLARAPAGIGTHLALTADSADAQTSLTVGWADAVVPVERLPELATALRSEEPDDVVQALSLASREKCTQSVPEWIRRCYRFDDAREIVAELQAARERRAASAAQLILAASPTAITVTMAALRAARNLTLAECLRQDYRVSCGFLEHPDLIEGIRAQIIDKDRQPCWRPATLADVTLRDIGGFFAPRADEAALL